MTSGCQLVVQDQGWQPGSQPGRGQNNLRTLPAILALFFSSSAPVQPCSLPPPVAPVIYQHWTTDGRFALVMAESPESFVQRFGYRTTPQDQETLDQFPASGIYRTGSAQPLRTFKRPVQPEDIVLLFTHGDSIFLVLKESFGLTLYRDGKEPVTIDGIEQRWVRAPWHYLAAVGWCDGGSGFSVEVLRSGPRPQIRVQVVESSLHVYDAMTGMRVLHEEFSLADPDRPTAEESELIAIEERYRRLISEERWLAAAQEIGPRVSPVLLAGCLDFDSTDLEDVMSDGGAHEAFEGLRPTSMGVDLPYAVRISHPDQSAFDVYRIPPRRALDFMCGKSFTRLEFTSEEIGNLDLDELWEALSGPTVALAGRWLSDEESEDYSGGIVELWSQSTGEWRMIGGAFFVDHPQFRSRSAAPSGVLP